MPWLESVAVSVRIPAGAAFDAEGKEGVASFTAEMVMRGAGPRDSRALVREFGLHGIHHAESVGVYFAKFVFATVSTQVEKGFELLADVLRRPHLPASQLESVRQGILQDLRGMEDDPAARLVRELRRIFYPDPWGRPATGEVATVTRITLEDVQQHFARFYQPEGAIVSVAGRFEWDDLLDMVGDFFGDWPGQKLPELRTQPPQVRYRHLEHKAQQVHIGIGFPGPAYGDPEFFQAWVAAAVLGWGSTSRFFRELREKRGLCYSVGTSYHSGRSFGGIFCYASTSAERAEEVLMVMVQEIHRLADGVRPEELTRIKAGVKSALIMSQESSAARSAVIARDWLFLGRIRSPQEIAEVIDGLTAESVTAYLQANPPRDLVVVTVGPKPLELSSEL